jgi:acyl-ACP thioesterase
MQAFQARPPAGRVFSTDRRVRSTEVTPAGRLRLDALARYLQEAAEDDLTDSGWREPQFWLVRRTALAVRSFPRLGQRVRLDTFCSATGPRWAERTTTITGPGGDLVQATAVWAAVSRADGRPVVLGPQFHALYDGAAGGRTVSARLVLPAPPAGLAAAPWPLRAADLDPARHVDNAVHWAAVEDVLAGLDWLPDTAEIEYHRAIEAGTVPGLAVSRGGDTVSLWLLNGGQRLASARLARLDGAPGPGARPGERAPAARPA